MIDEVEERAYARQTWPLVVQLGGAHLGAGTARAKKKSLSERREERRGREREEGKTKRRDVSVWGLFGL